MEPAGRDREEVGHGARGLAAEHLELEAEVVSARPAGSALAANQVGLDQDAIADIEPGGVGPQALRGAHTLVAGKVRQVDERMGSGQSMQIGAADANTAGAEEHLAGDRSRRLHFDEPDLAQRRNLDPSHQNTSLPADGSVLGTWRMSGR